MAAYLYQWWKKNVGTFGMAKQYLHTHRLMAHLTDRIDRITLSATLAFLSHAERLRAAGEEVLDLGVGEPHFNTPDHIKEAAHAAIEANLTRYTPVAGIAELRKAIADRHRADFHSNYVSTEVIVCTGGKQALFNAIQVIVQSGDEVIVPIPYWVSYRDIVEYSGGTCIWSRSAPENRLRVTCSEIERAVTRRTRAIILNSPSNPSGAVMDPEEVRAVAALARAKGIYIISDECYAYLAYSDTYLSLGSLQASKDRLVIAGSLSKAYAMTGWRVGYALAPAPIVSAMEKLQSQCTAGATSISQRAALAALNGPQGCIETMKREYLILRDRTISALNSITGVVCDTPDGAFYAFANVSRLLSRAGLSSSEALANRLLDKCHVITIPGEVFGLPGYLRLSFATAPEILDRALERLAALR
jgi:aspartate aminotransferase